MPHATLQLGSQGREVKTAQKHLEARGYSCGVHHVDGIFGADTYAAVVRFQKHDGLRPTGVVAKDTWAELIPHQRSRSMTTRSASPPVVDLTQTQAEQFALVAKRRVTGRDGQPAPSYRLGVEVANLADPHPSTLDCSELTQWAVFQITGDSWVDGSFNQFPAGKNAGKEIEVAEARDTVGALVFLTTDNTATGTIHHVGVVCQEKGKPFVAQARSAHLDPQCGIWPFDSQEWALACKVPILKYHSS